MVEISKVSADEVRKRKGNTSASKTPVEKRRKCSAIKSPTYPNCQHKQELCCTHLSLYEIQAFNIAFYAITKRDEQDDFILKFCRYLSPEWKTAYPESPCSKPPNSFEYTIPNQAGTLLPVCRDTFLKALQIPDNRLIGVLEIFNKGILHIKRNKVISYINKLNACESHHGRGKIKRVYMSSELSIKKLWKMYNLESTEVLKVKESFFKMVLNTKFNITFGTLAFDKCGICLQIDKKISQEINPEKKKSLKQRKDIHKKQVNSFLTNLKTKNHGCFLLSFICQKNLVLPKVSDKAAYYLTKFNCHYLTVIREQPVGLVNNRDNINIYSWTENQARKSSNEVASIIHNELKTTILEGYSKVQLVVDGCAGQNKNIVIIGMCASWLANDAPESIENIEIIYPLTGHLFSESDNILRQIEKELKTKKTIIDPSEYGSVFSHFGILKEIDQDWTPFNWKKVVETCIKKASDLHFKISTCRKVMLRKTSKGKVLVKGEIAFNTDGAFENTITKPKQNLDMTPEQLTIGVPLKRKKVKDVKSLLTKEFGEAWKDRCDLQWYKAVIEENEQIMEDVDYLECECLEKSFEPDDPEEMLRIACV